MTKNRAPRNRTLILTDVDRKELSRKLISIEEKTTLSQITNKTINQDLFTVLDFLPDNFVDLLFVDPPYNLTKTFNSNTFKEMKTKDYIEWIDSWLSKLIRTLKKTASIYICGDYRSSGAIQQVGEKYFKVRNRIVWEREKGRGAKANWKNNTEDIWYFTVSDDYTFNLDAVKLKKKVLAPYRINGKPKDWEESDNGNYRLTHPSNIWTDITVPFWSMPENTDHPTQKPEKLLAKIILASSNEGDFVLDPFLGSGTTSVVAKKLNRKYLGIELDNTYACLAEKRLSIAEKDKSIQGYFDGVFWERNSLKEQFKINLAITNKNDERTPLFNFIEVND
ncbi:MAG: site-specific DNA-methyltransferase [Ignavibacterium sp.]|nr:site-specific DNA-methyltransferase [Ignavibacterium sp.]